MMIATKTPYPQIGFDHKDRPVIGSLRVPVSLIVEMIHGENRMTPVRVQEGWPSLSLAQIYTALAFYHDHKVEMDAAMAEEEARLEASVAKTWNAPLQEKLARAKEEFFSESLGAQLMAHAYYFDANMDRALADSLRRKAEESDIVNHLIHLPFRRI